MAGPAAAGLAAGRAGAGRPRGRPRGARRGRRRRDGGRRAGRGPGRRAPVVRRRVLARPPIAAGDGGGRRRPAAVPVPRAGGPVRRRGRDPAHERACAAGPARPRRAAAGAPRAGGGRRRRAGPRGGAHARAAGGGRRARRGPGAVVRPRRTVQRRARCGTRTRACRCPRPRSRPRSAARCGGRWRRRAGRRPPAAGRTSARCCTRSRRSTRRARRPSCPRRSTGGGRSSGSAPGGRRWRPVARRTRWCTGSPGTCAAPGEPLLVEGAFAVDTDRASLRGSVDRIERVEDGADGPVVRVVDLKTGASPPSVSKAAENPQLGAYQLAVDAGAFDGLPDGTTSGGAQLVFLGTGATAVTRSQEPLGPEVDGPSWARRDGRPGGRQDGRVDVRGDRQRPVRPLPGAALVPGPRRGRTGGRMTLSAAQIAALVGQPPPTPEQRVVIEAPLGPSLVVAGAGSGKTETMAARVVWLLANGIVEPDQVLGLTFTRKAAGELAERVRKRLRTLARAAAAEGRRARRDRRRGTDRRAGGPRAADDLHVQLLRGLPGVRPRAAARPRPVGAAARRGRAVAAGLRGGRGVERRPRHRRRDVDGDRGGARAVGCAGRAPARRRRRPGPGSRTILDGLAATPAGHAAARAVRGGQEAGAVAGGAGARPRARRRVPHPQARRRRDRLRRPGRARGPARARRARRSAPGSGSGSGWCCSTSTRTRPTRSSPCSARCSAAGTR